MKVKNGSGKTLLKQLINSICELLNQIFLLVYNNTSFGVAISYGNCASPGTNLVALCSMCLSLSMFFAKYGFQIDTQYSR